MEESPTVVRNISDTALWAAYFRAEETKRPDALFRDPYAERLEEGKGSEIARTIPRGQDNAWAWVTRTYLFDQFIVKEVEAGADLIVNCAAGLDARPYRMQWSEKLQWVELDLPEILAYKEKRLAAEKPRCALQRIAVDLSNATERRRVFESIAPRGKRALVLTEGLLIYLAEEGASSLARDLSAVGSFERWILDMHSPRLLGMLQKETGKALDKAGAPFQFGPVEGPGFFGPCGWDTIQAQGTLRVAARFGRPPFFLRLLAKLPEPAVPWKRPWHGVCIMQKRKPERAAGTQG